MGRPRKSGKRHPSGKLVQPKVIDKGTPEIQSRRAWAAGQGDQTLTWHVVGILRAHDQITEEQYRAACEYRRLFCLLYRKPDVSAASMEGVERGRSDGAPEEVLERARRRITPFEAIMAGLVREHGRRAKDAWENVVIYDRHPRWMEPKFPTAADVKDAALFRLIIEAMEKAHSFKIAA